MSKPYPGPWILRSMLFVPGHMGRLIAKGAASAADCVVLDLEDAVPPEGKVEARATIRESLESGLFKGRPVMVRVNAFESGLTQADVDAVACEALGGFVYAMTRTAGEIQRLDALLAARERALSLAEGHFNLIPLVETPLGVINAASIATASERVVALLFGGEDYLAGMAAQHDADQMCFHTPRVQIVMAARAAGVEPVDTPYVDVHDEVGLRQHALRGRQLGMAGVLVMSPRQIPTAHAIYTPSSAEVQEARQALEMLEETRRAGRGLTVREGRYISPVAEKKARRLLARAAAIRDLDSFSHYGI